MLKPLFLIVQDVSLTFAVENLKGVAFFKKNSLDCIYSCRQGIGSTFSF